MTPARIYNFIVSTIVPIVPIAFSIYVLMPEKRYFKISAVPPKPDILYTGKRPTSNELKKVEKRHRRSVQTFWLPRHLSGCDDYDTWPKELRYMAMNIGKESATIAINIRKYYPHDVILNRFASFIEENDCEGAAFDYDWKYSKFPKNVRGGFKILPFNLSLTSTPHI